MTAALQQPPPPSHPLLRLTLAARLGGAPRRIDGAWWPRSHDLLVELPLLLAGLPAAWGNITAVTVNAPAWSPSPGRLLVANQLVRLRRTDTRADSRADPTTDPRTDLRPETPHAPSTICLLTPGRGRWDLLVVPPETLEASAESAMATAAE
ncbi:hypothetical protein DMA15_19285 [Streptomyces sp. WAC 01529]|uniref:DUF5994 family protein n=1 Tax=Streptomyces sp. WAC 01529 TaxID=2203205 RepID=UPI000F705DA5|nr:DUF5994 family protein [Streptomyces sp. WAC 01529]AZM54441.1 hypothetical protein DMA15_19285 [Streptomyces sp. WAC 01529]